MLVFPLCYGLPEDGEHLPQHVGELICKDNLLYILHMASAFCGIVAVTGLKTRYICLR